MTEAAPGVRAGGPDVAELRSMAETVASEAAALAARIRASAVTDVDTKSSETDVVTAGDRESERLIRVRLARLRPGEPVLGEEEGRLGGTQAASGVSWVVDPIDGTVNYLYGLPWYAVSVAAQWHGRSVAAAVVEPESGRVWTAARGMGATMDAPGKGRRSLRVSAADRLEVALIGTGFSYSKRRRGWQAGLAAELLTSARDLRRNGSSVLDLCAVAAGWLDGFVEHGLSPWDWAGGALIAEEAGAVLRLPTADGTDPDGLGADVTIAAAPGIAVALHDLVRRVVSRG